MPQERDTRRAFLTLAGASALLAACRKDPTVRQERVALVAPSASATPPQPSHAPEPEVTATEDLMREHGVIRRVLVVYREAARRLRVKPTSIPLEGLGRAAQLMRSFGEAYHEQKLEEAHIFPTVRKAGGQAARELDTLLAQHQRGREITDYIIAVSKRSALTAAEPLAQTLDAFALMYEEHAAREDTIVFPAWKQALSEKELDDLGELFERIEHDTFGKDGFDDAVEQITAIESTFGIDPAALTAPAPPKL